MRISRDLMSRQRYHTGPLQQISLNQGGFYGVGLSKMEAGEELRGDANSPAFATLP